MTLTALARICEREGVEAMLAELGRAVGHPCAPLPAREERISVSDWMFLKL